jgi:hypothetical protein
MDTNSHNIYIVYTTLPGVVADTTGWLDSYTPVAADMDILNWHAGDTTTVTGSTIRTRNPSDSMGLYFYIPTTNYKNALLTWTCERSSNGMRAQIFDYSVDGGTTWRTSGLSMMSDSVNAAFSQYAVNFFADTTTANNAHLVFRIRFAVNNTGSSGNNRFDHISLQADTITAATINPSAVNEIVNATPAFTIVPNPASTSLTISTEIEGNKSIIVRDAQGRTVYAGLLFDKSQTLDISNYVAGTYFVTVGSNSTKTSSTSRFVKQ